MSIKITIPNTSSDTLTFGSANTPTAAQVAGIDSGSSNGQLAIYTTASGTSTERVRVDSSGNVGIGTSSPSKKLDVNGSINANSIELGLNGESIKKASGNFYIETGSASPLIFSTNNAERMRFDGSGNLLVGTTSQYSGAKNNFYRSGAGQIISVVTSVNSGNNDMMAFLDGDSNVCGYIQANTTANTLSYVTSSDYRLKQNIQPMTDGLAKVMQLKPSTWNWKSAPEVSGQGFIAHELQEVIPDAVCGEKDELDADNNPKYQGVDTSFLVATLTAAIQELKELVDTQASTITAMTARIEALEKK